MLTIYRMATDADLQALKNAGKLHVEVSYPTIIAAREKTDKALAWTDKDGIVGFLGTHARTDTVMAGPFEAMSAFIGRNLVELYENSLRSAGLQMYWFHVAHIDVTVEHSTLTTGADHEQTVQMRKTTQKWAKNLPGMPQHLYAELAEIEPDDIGAKEKRQLQELRRRLLETGQTPEEAMRAVWGGKITDASSRLQQAVARGLAVQKVPSGTTQGEGRIANWKELVERSDRVKKIQEDENGSIYRRTL